MSAAVVFAMKVTAAAMVVESTPSLLQYLKRTKDTCSQTPG